MLGSIFKTLDMNYENGLTDSTSKSMSAYQEQIYKMVNEKLGVNAIYFLRNADGIPQIPLIYFAAIDRYDADTIAELHRLAWNLGDAPLLFVVTPENLLIYNNYAAPKRTADGKLDVNAGLVDTIEAINTLESERQLLQYHRLKLETGEFWRENADNYRFDIKNRVDTTLMNNLRFMRRILVTNIRKRYSPKELSDEKLISIVHALLGRSILTKYLEERKDKNGESVFPNGFFSQFKDGATTYSDVLDDKAATYELFKELTNHFNGDMFPLVPQEYDVITTDELTELKHFILGTTDFENEQLLLWPLYSFNIIPIQLISSIYELFFHLIFKQSPKAGRFLSSVANFDALFVNSFIGIHGEERLLKYLSVVLYSKVFVYYALMTSRRWLVERDELNVEELLTYPIPEPTSEELDEACCLYDAAYISAVIDETRIDAYAYDLYRLKDYEREFIENAVSNIYDYFYVKGNSTALSPLTNETAKRYCDVLTDILQNSLGSLENISTILYRGNSPLVVIQILFESTSAHVINRADELDVLLSQLDRLLLDERSGSMAVKRNVRVYKKDSVYIIKPNQSRYWSYSSACNDADEIYADIMRAWRENNERY